MVKLYLIRHAESEWNPIGRYQGLLDPELSERGREQAKSLGERLKDIELHAIYSSPLKRTMQTALEIARRKGMEVIPEERVIEIDHGVVLGKASVIESNGLFFSWYYCVLMGLGSLLFVRPYYVIRLDNYKHWEIPALGFFFAIGDILYNMALLFTLSSYVASAERLSLLFALMYGRIFLGESLNRAFLPAILMMVGNILIGFG